MQTFSYGKVSHIRAKGARPFESRSPDDVRAIQGRYAAKENAWRDSEKMQRRNLSRPSPFA